MKKKTLMAMIAVIMAISLCAGLAACDPAQDRTTQGKGVSYFTLDINPSVEFVLDDEGKVLSYRALNEDAKVMLFEVELKGLTVEKATDTVLDLAIELGYLTADNKGVETTVVSQDETKEAEILSKIKAEIQTKNGEVKIDIVLHTDGGFAYGRRLNRLKEQYPDHAAIQALTVSRYRLILSAMAADPTLTVEKAAQMEVSELTEIVSDAMDKAEEYATDAYEAAVEAAENIYETTVRAVKEGIWLAEYVKFYPLDALDATQYGLLRAAEQTLDGLLDLAEQARETIDASLISADLDEIAALLGVSREELIGQDGTLTLDSLEDTIDRIVKNKTEEERDVIEDRLETIEDKLDEWEDSLEEEALPSDLVAQVKEAVKEIKIWLEGVEIDFDRINEESLEELQEDLEDKADELWERMENKLTKEQKAHIDGQIAKIQGQIDQAKAEFDRKVKEAEQIAKEALKELKNARKNDISA